MPGLTTKIGFFLSLAAAVLVSGCKSGVTYVDEPVTNRMIDTVSGDKWVFTLRNNPKPGFFWEGESDDDRVDVRVLPPSDDGEGGFTVIEIHILNGFDGQATAVLMNRNEDDGKTARSVNIGFFSRTGHYAPWK